MPELPEVETIRRVLEPQLRGQQVVQVVVSRPEVIAHPAAEDFCHRLAGQTVAGMARSGKFLVLQLASGDRVVVHLRMTGCLLLAPADCPPEKHTHVVFRLNSGGELRFSDQRRFGRLWLLAAGQADTCTGMTKLGRDPFDPDCTAAYLADRLGKRKRSIKECLLEQSVIAGIGNIYSDEILFAAGLDPARPADSLTRREWQRLAAVIPERLDFFIRTNAITPEDYLRTKGREYRNTPYLQIYGHAGAPCPCCGQPLVRRVIGGRSSISCPRCQPAQKRRRPRKP